MDMDSCCPPQSQEIHVDMDKVLQFSHLNASGRMVPETYNLTCPNRVLEFPDRVLWAFEEVS